MKWALLALVFAACDEHTSSAVLVCHNANCARATDPFKDSMISSLEDSLALEYRGRPAIDGMEIDVAWDPASVFPHVASLFAGWRLSQIKIAALRTSTKRCSARSASFRRYSTTASARALASSSKRRRSGTARGPKRNS